MYSVDGWLVSLAWGRGVGSNSRNSRPSERFRKGQRMTSPGTYPHGNELLFVLRILLHCSSFSSQQLDIRLFKHALPDLRTTWRSRVCARIATRDSVHSSRNAGSCVWCVSKLLQVETASMEMQCGCIAELTDTFVFVFSPSRSSRVVRIDVRNGNQALLHRVKWQNAFHNGRECSRVIWRLLFPAFQDAVLQWRSGWVSGTTSRSAARQCSRITIFRLFWVSRLPLSRNCKIGTSNCH